MRFANCFCLLALLAITRPLLAQDESSTSIGLAYGQDDRGAADLSFSAHYFFAQHQQLGALLAYGRNAEDDVGEYSTVSYALMAASSPYEMLSVDVDAQYWEDPDDANITTLDGKLAYNSESFSVYLRPQIRTYTVYLELTDAELALVRLFFRNPNLTKDRHYYSRGLAVGGDYLGFYPLRFGVEAGRSSYSADLTVLDSDTLRTTRLSPSTLNMAYALESEHVRTHLNLDLQDVSLGASYQRSRSEVDSAIAQNIGLSIDWAFSSALLGSATVTQYYDSNDNDSTFVTVGVSLSW